MRRYIDLVCNHHAIFMERDSMTVAVQTYGNGIASAPLLFRTDAEHFLAIPSMINIPIGVVDNDIIGPAHIKVQMVVGIIDASIVTDNANSVVP